MSAYLLNREADSLLARPEQADGATEDRLFAGERYEGKALRRQTFRHCTFANVSFKQTTFVDCIFEDCVFINCYFRKADWKNTKFAATRFISSDFPSIVVENCTFTYTFFDCCFIEPRELRHSLPSAPNLRRDLTANLAMQAEALGFSDNARTYRLWSIKADEDHLRASWMNEGEWYRKHVPGVARLAAFGRWSASRINGSIWGHGERVFALARTFALTSLVIYPTLYYVLRRGFSPVLGRPDATPTFTDFVFLSLDRILPSAGISVTSPIGSLSRLAVCSEVLIGLVFAGLFVTYLLRSITRR